MSAYLALKKDDFQSLISELVKIRSVVAPVDRGNNAFSFEEVKSAKDIALNYLPTILPPKKYFMPQREKIQEFNKAENRWTPVLADKDVVLFGVHTCDLSGIEFLNTVMEQTPKDVNYAARRAKITLIGLECNAYCDSYASCKVMGTYLPNGGYDLFFTELKKHFIIHVGTAQGESLAKKIKVLTKATDALMKELDQLRKKKEKTFSDEVNVPNSKLKHVFSNAFESSVWKDIDERCVSCSNCTNVCPTCYCFDIKDEIGLDLTSGYRYRVWDSCQSEEFARVAGGENFRKSRGDRQRHRYMRKFLYPVDKFGRYTCTGCGRCSRTCMAKISLKETINAISEEKKLVGEAK